MAGRAPVTIKWMWWIKWTTSEPLSMEMSDMTVKGPSDTSYA
jgi:hypothetical protein